MYIIKSITVHCTLAIRQNDISTKTYTLNSYYKRNKNEPGL